MNDSDKSLENPSAQSESSSAYCDPVIEFYKKDVDRTLLRENLRLSVEERIRKAESLHRSIDQWRGAARQRRREDSAEHGQ